MLTEGGGCYHRDLWSVPPCLLKVRDHYEIAAVLDTLIKRNRRDGMTQQGFLLLIFHFTSLSFHQRFCFSSHQQH